MIVVNIKKANDVINEITMEGHAMYDVHGKDIVCASASSILITTVNAIHSFDNDAITVNQKNMVTITIKKHDSVTDGLINNMITLLKDLEKQYKKNIKINE